MIRWKSMQTELNLVYFTTRLRGWPGEESLRAWVWGRRLERNLATPYTGQLHSGREKVHPIRNAWTHTIVKTVNNYGEGKRTRSSWCEYDCSIVIVPSEDWRQMKPTFFKNALGHLKKGELLRRSGFLRTWFPWGSRNIKIHSFLNQVVVRITSTSMFRPGQMGFRHTPSFIKKKIDASFMTKCVSSPTILLQVTPLPTTYHIFRKSRLSYVKHPECFPIRHGSKQLNALSLIHSHALSCTTSGIADFTYVCTERAARGKPRNKRSHDSIYATNATFRKSRERGGPGRRLGDVEFGVYKMHARIQ